MKKYMNTYNETLEAAGMLSPRKAAAILAALPEVYLNATSKSERMIPMSHARSSAQTPVEVTDREISKPDMLPTTLQEFDRMSLQERNWLYQHRPEIYNRFMKQIRKEW